MADFDTALEECEYQGMWFAEVARYMLRERGCSFFICHWHLYDYLNHIHLGDVDPVCPGYEAERAEQYVDYFPAGLSGGGSHFGSAVGGRRRAYVRGRGVRPRVLARCAGG